MKESLKNVFLVFSFLLLLFSFIFYATRPKPTPEYRVTAYLQNTYEESGHHALRLGMEQAAFDYKLELVFSPVSAMESLAQPVENMEEAEEKDSDGVIIEPTADQTTMTLPKHQALLFVNGQGPTMFSIPTITADNEKIGEELGEEILRHKQAGGTVLILASEGPSQEEEENQRGLIASFTKQQIDYQIITYPNDLAEGLETLFAEQAYEAIVCFGRGGSEELGRLKKSMAALDEVPIYGFGFSNTLLTLVDQGVVAGLGVSNQFAVGYAAVEQIIRQIEGQTVRPPQIARLIVTQENLFDTENQKLLFPLIQ
ncbi:sugar ABC transporter substrate-binding protein [Enterococcus sp. LJL98]